METISVTIHHIQFSSFFLFISHMPVKAAADVNESAWGTVLSVKLFKTTKSMIQQTAKNNIACRQSFAFELVMNRVVLPFFLRAHIIHPMTLITV